MIITAGKGFKEIFTVAAATVICIFILHCIAATIWNRLEVRVYKAFQLYECITEQKMLKMDYSKLDSPKVKDLKERIRRDNNWGAGLFSVFWRGNVVPAIIVGAPVIYYIIKSEKLIVFVLLLIMIVCMAVSKKGGAYFHKRVAAYMYKNYEEDEERKERTTVSWLFAFGDGYFYNNGN